jgi:preprotein translocase subunit YajC
MDKGGETVIAEVMPWWVLMIIVFIFFSGYMSYRAMRAERKLEQQFIEQEGQIYMNRLEEARRLKQREQ